MMLPNVKLACALMLMLLVMLLTGCATNSPNPGANCPQLPPMPLADMPKRSQTYSAIARGNIKSWRGTLTNASPPGKP